MGRGSDIWKSPKWGQVTGQVGRFTERVPHHARSRSGVRSNVRSVICLVESLTGGPTEQWDPCQGLLRLERGLGARQLCGLCFRAALEPQGGKRFPSIKDHGPQETRGWTRTPLPISPSARSAQAVAGAVSRSSAVPTALGGGGRASGEVPTACSESLQGKRGSRSGAMGHGRSRSHQARCLAQGGSKDPLGTSVCISFLCT